MRILAVLPLLALSACIFGGGDHAETPPARLLPARSAIPTAAETRQCTGSLVAKHVAYRLLPDRREPNGCSRIGTVKLIDIGTPISGLGAMRCGLADKFVNWVRYGIRPAARQILGSDVVKIESFGTYACRGVRGHGRAKRLSEHAVADAVDIAAFGLADGRRVTVQSGWNSSDEQVRAFLRTVHASACKRFVTTLGPDYNAAHYNHFHVDMGGSHFCR